eukprot:1006875-Amphidinium_carterae.1
MFGDPCQGPWLLVRLKSAFVQNAPSFSRCGIDSKQLLCSGVAEVLIAYGAGDADARVLSMTLRRLDAYFECCQEPCGSGGRTTQELDSFLRVMRNRLRVWLRFILCAWLRWASVGHWGRYSRGDFKYAAGEESLRHALKEC